MYYFLKILAYKVKRRVTLDSNMISALDETFLEIVHSIIREKNVLQILIPTQPGMVRKPGISHNFKAHVKTIYI